MNTADAPEFECKLFFKVTTISAFRSSDPSRHRRLSVFGFAGSDQQPEADLPQVLPAQAEGRRLLLHRLRLVPQSAHESQDLRHLDGHVSVALRLGWYLADRVVPRIQEYLQAM